MKKKLFFALGIVIVFVFVFVGQGLINFDHLQANIFKSKTIFDKASYIPSQKDWKRAFETNDFSFFQKKISKKDFVKFKKFITLYPKKIDIEVILLPDDTVFFSFLGIKKHSTKLYDGNYGYIGKNFVMLSPSSTFSQDPSNVNIYVNESKFPLPLDGEYLLLLNDSEKDVRLRTLSEKEKQFIAPQEKFTIEGENRENNKNVIGLESIKYGFISKFISKNL